MLQPCNSEVTLHPWRVPFEDSFTIQQPTRTVACKRSLSAPHFLWHAVDATKCCTIRRGRPSRPAVLTCTDFAAIEDRSVETEQPEDGSPTSFHSESSEDSQSPPSPPSCLGVGVFASFTDSVREEACRHCAIEAAKWQHVSERISAVFTRMIDADASEDEDDYLPASDVLSTSGPESRAEAECDTCIPLGDVPNKSGFSLLEQYGVFGAPAGSWVSAKVAR